ncbi:hypothetical protein B0T25DRAFT_564792 [Lasiosphaeria hispida]|uniref:LPXTG-domain-containing protein n=1 Tax=Lasiosphaeria hispida TaxID=260671 RepID=A0AAJ0HQY8_9PEZI|nr:hypothetical protein B0T25DRAFT_564792 [Lasiosphaeria hispida]
MVSRLPWAILAVLSISSQLASTLQVTPNSPCAKTCQDSPELDLSDPNSSNTRNSDISCQDMAHTGTSGSKWKDCMSCLQNSTFSQGAESDQMWFLYNLRYSLSYCVFAYPNASDAGSTPCSTSMACGPLRTSFQHGILNQKNMTAYSYCAVDGEDGGDAKDTLTYERCVSCVSAEGNTEYQANYVVALEAGCQQQPGPGKILGLNDTIFAPNPITIVDPLTLIKGPSSDTSLPATSIAGIVAGVLAIFLIIVAVVFVCCRKRRNKRDRASFEANPYGGFRNRHRSSLSFQCQTHSMSPRFWPGGEEGLADDKRSTHYADDVSRRSSMWKPHISNSSYEKTLEPIRDQEWESPYDEKPGHFTLDEKPPTFKKSGITSTVPLHHITTSVPAYPPHVHASPSSAAMYHGPADLTTPLSAESARSTTALLPGIKPYIPADHGIHGSPGSQAVSAFSSPVSGATVSPLLKSYGWPDQRPPQQIQPYQPRSRLSSGAGIGVAVAIPPPPPPKSPRLGIPVKKNSKSNSNLKVSPINTKSSPIKQNGSPVESWEIQTAFSAPPKKR